MKQRPIDNIPKIGELFTGPIVWEAEQLNPSVTGTGKYQIEGRFRCAEPTEPPDYHGRMLFQNFIIGTKDDPMAEDPLTWKAPRASIGYRELCEFLDASGTPQLPDLEESCAMAVAQHAKAQGKTEIETQQANNKDGTPNQYAGKRKMRVRRWFKVGTRPAVAEAAPEDPAVEGNHLDEQPAPVSTGSAPPPAAARPQ